ncbi:TPA: sugar translocase [Clostridium perfringens]|nr:sugar translocase [Clostridium perfringens]
MRKKNSILNIITSFIEQFLNLILGFIIRTIFIYTLGKDYLGLNGLFTQILTVLSLAELGFGTALNYSMYKPLAEKNNKKLRSLTRYYKKIYNIIGITILIIGLLVIPLLPYIIKTDTQIDINYNIIYIMYLINTVSSYLLYAYKSSILNASQKQYLIKKTSILISICVSILQIVVLYVTRNYYIYLSTILLKNIVLNISIAKKADKIFPFLREKEHEKITTEEKVKIKQDVSSISIYKISDVMLSSTDNIMISALIGIAITGIYSNYSYIITTINTFLGLIFSSIIASVGNLDATEDCLEKNKVFNKIFFVNIWTVGICSICLWQLLTPFITIWIGKTYTLDKLTVFIIVLNFLIKGLENTTYVFRIGAGVFQQSKYRPIASVIINLGLSIILAKYIGIAGVFLGTIISRLLTYFWVDPIVIYRDLFKKSSKEYFYMYFKGIISISISGIIVNLINKFIIYDNIKFFIVRLIITFIIPNLVFIIIYRKDINFIYFKEMLLDTLRKKLFLKLKSKTE